MNYVLVITEDKAISLSLKMILKENFIVEEITPREVFKVIPSRRPNIIFLDSQFSELNSLGILEKLLEIDATFTVIKLVSSFNKIAQTSLEKGAFDVLEKPFDFEKVSHMVKRGIERDQLLRENESLKSKNIIEKNRESVKKEEIKGEDLFELLIQVIINNFMGLSVLCTEILKVLRRHFYLNNMVLFLRDGEKFVPVASLGLERKLLDEMKIDFSHPVIRWFMKKSCVLNLLSEETLPMEVKNFVEVLNGKIVFPFKTFKGNLIGFFITGEKSTGQPVTIADISLLSMVCDYLTMVFENTFLYNKISSQKSYQEAIFENVPSGIIGVDKEGKILILNKFAEKILRVKVAEVKGKEVEKLGSQIADYIRKTLQCQNIIAREEFTYIPTRAFFGISTGCLKNGDEVEGAVAVFQDLTFVKELEKKEKTVEKNKYWNIMAARLSHELRNPLVAIKTFAQMLPAKYEDEEFRTKFSEIVQEEITRINNIVESINKLADSQSLNIGMFPLVELIEDLRKRYAEKFSGENIKFEAGQKNNCSMEGDSLKLREALGYIFDFCCEDVEKENTISLSSRREGDKIFLEIFEKGKKFDIETIEDVFIPFNPHMHSTLSIGMILSKKIIEAHNGELFIEPELSGKKITVVLPYKENEKNSCS